MKKQLLFLLSIILTISCAFAQTNWQTMLKEDVVKITDNKMVSQEYYLLKTVDEEGNPLNLQLMAYAEAPNTGFISRDNFVAIESMFSTIFILELCSEIQLEYELINEPIGDVDFEYKLFMNSQGVQIQLNDKNDGTSEKNTMKWNDLFAE